MSAAINCQRNAEGKWCASFGCGRAYGAHPRGRLVPPPKKRPMTATTWVRDAIWWPPCAHPVPLTGSSHPPYGGGMGERSASPRAARTARGSWGFELKSMKNPVPSLSLPVGCKIPTKPPTEDPPPRGTKRVNFNHRGFTCDNYCPGSRLHHRRPENPNASNLHFTDISAPA